MSGGHESYWSLSVTYLHTLKLSTKSVLRTSETDIVDSLADTNISNFSFVDQVFKFLPRRVLICGQRLINDDPLLFL